MKTKILPLLLTGLLIFCACHPPKKEITVVIREPGSGTREAFDRTVSDGTHFLEERSENGKKIDRNSVYAIVQTKGGTVLSTVAADRYAIGYVSPSALNESVKCISVGGVLPTEENVLNGAYPLRRPFVIVVNQNRPLTASASDFLRYLQSDRMIEHTRTSNCVFSSDPMARSAKGQDPIPVRDFTPLPSFPSDEKILLRGSTSLEKLILSAARDYAALYGVDPSKLFDIQLEGSSVGVKAASEDRTGNVIGLSSAEVTLSHLSRFTVAYDALAVIVHPQNPINNLSVSELYAVFSGSVQYFDELEHSK